MTLHIFFYKTVVVSQYPYVVKSQKNKYKIQTEHQSNLRNRVYKHFIIIQYMYLKNVIRSWLLVGYNKCDYFYIRYRIFMRQSV